MWNFCGKTQFPIPWSCPSELAESDCYKTHPLEKWKLLLLVSFLYLIILFTILLLLLVIITSLFFFLYLFATIFLYFLWLRNVFICLFLKISKICFEKLISISDLSTVIQLFWEWNLSFFAVLLFLLLLKFR